MRLKYRGLGRAALYRMPADEMHCPSLVIGGAVSARRKLVFRPDRSSFQRVPLMLSGTLRVRGGYQGRVSLRKQGRISPARGRIGAVVFRLESPNRKNPVSVIACNTVSRAGEAGASPPAVSRVRQGRQEPRGLPFVINSRRLPSCAAMNMAFGQSRLRL